MKNALEKNIANSSGEIALPGRGADERDAVFRRWLLAAGTADAGAFTPTAEIHAAWSAFAGDRAGPVGWLASRMRAAGVAPHRTNDTKGWRWRPANVEEIKRSIAAAEAERKKARRARDPDAVAAAMRALLWAKRSAGGALLDGGISAPSAFDIGDTRADQWRGWARLGEAEFAAKVEAIARRSVASLAKEHIGGTCPQARMSLTPWRRTPDGALTRELTAVEVGGSDGKFGGGSPNGPRT